MVTPSFGLALGCTFVGLVIGAACGYPIFGAFAGAVVAGGVIWTLGDDAS